MEFSELFTQSTREVLSLARSKGLVSYFDYSGPYLRLAGTNERLRAAIHRILLGMTDCIDSGFVFFFAEASPPVGELSEVAVYAAGTGTSAPAEMILQVLERLQLAAPQSHLVPPGRASTLPTRASGRCPATGGAVEFLDEGPDGWVISLHARLAATEIPGAQPLPWAAGVEAWLVSSVPGGLDSVGRRLRRLGWHVTPFESIKQAVARLQGTHGSSRLPWLLIAAESAGKELEQLERLAKTMPSLRTVLAVVLGSPALQARGMAAVDIRPLPLSPQELEEFTAHVDWRTSTEESRETVPSPLYVEDRRLVLVVDDSPVNQLLARGQLEALGYDAAVVGNGAEALAYCRRQVPDMVLMDVDMPVMNGLETTEQLRTLQQLGALPPFPIVAATWAEGDRRREECVAVGMDGYLSKPVGLRSLANEIHRVLPARQWTRSADNR